MTVLMMKPSQHLHYAPPRHGPTLDTSGVTFRVWAPERTAVALVLVDSDGRELKRHALTHVANGFFATTVKNLEPGALYFYQLDDDPQLYADPASHYQPLGVLGPSQVIDHRQFKWSDHAWRGVEMPGQVFYELHIGTFTPEGTWAAAIEKLPHLRDVGVTVAQVMPVSAFPGEFGWGYDGVFWYAPTQLYGTPDDFRAFVDRAHALDLGVVLDVVYNHFGPAGNYSSRFSSYYTSGKHHTEWGSAINFDDKGAGPVRDFVTENAAYWIREFHIDGLRLDATQAIVDDSADHIVAELTRAARAAAGDRSIVVFSEDEKNRCNQIFPCEKGGWETDGLYNDDFHHACRVAATGNNEAYYRDFTGSPQELISAIRFSHLFQGQWNARHERVRGVPTGRIPAHHFIHQLQNHDQVANSARGLRTHLLTSPGRHRALTALLLLGPQTPMLFMGQEFGAATPFLYFADHEPELAELVHHGRREFMRQFPRIKSWSDVADLRRPAEEQTFLESKLNWDECQVNLHMVDLHRDLLRLRKTDATFSRQNRRAIEGSVIGPEAFVLRWLDDESGDDRLMLFNLGRDFDWHPVAEPLAAPPLGRQWSLIWSSEDPRYGGMGTPHFDGKHWPVPGHAAAVFAARELL
jgi:maltooligosyltrehalose trehalohydrolase